MAPYSSCNATVIQLRIMGVEVQTPAYAALKDGGIKLCDIITHLNEDKVTDGELFRLSTRDKTRPELTLKRNRKIPSIANLLSKGIMNLYALFCSMCI